ncbi:response regulator [Lunatibacter salilacus]|uniref:response regulator n=1 Tax=Lunatibacter salilacus TaxID=2483804 RepID=UPI00131E11C3|nr:response regulator [Lunatibacter salilacus]
MKDIRQVCLIEDDPIAVLLSKKFMQLTGAIEEIIVYGNGKEAYEGLKSRLKEGKQLPNLIFLDLNMPIWDGWNFLKEFKKLNILSKPIIYILTSSTSQCDKDKAKNFGLDDHYLVKPIDLKKIKEIFKKEVESGN